MHNRRQLCIHRSSCILGPEAVCEAYRNRTVSTCTRAPAREPIGLLLLRRWTASSSTAAYSRGRKSSVTRCNVRSPFAFAQPRVCADGALESELQAAKDQLEQLRGEWHEDHVQLSERADGFQGEIDILHKRAGDAIAEQMNAEVMREVAEGSARFEKQERVAACLKMADERDVAQGKFIREQQQKESLQEQLAQCALQLQASESDVAAALEEFSTLQEQDFPHEKALAEEKKRTAEMYNQMLAAMDQLRGDKEILVEEKRELNRHIQAVHDDWQRQAERTLEARKEGRVWYLRLGNVACSPFTLAPLLFRCAVRGARAEHEWYFGGNGFEDVGCGGVARLDSRAARAGADSVGPGHAVRLADNLPDQPVA